MVDPDARHIHKTVHARQDGYKGHVAVEPDTGIYTGVELTKGTGEDNHEAAVGQRLLQGEPDDVEVLGDSAYGTGETRQVLADPGRSRSAVIKPRPLRPPVPDGFTIDDFDVGEEDQQVTCPAGHTRPITRKRNVVFGPQQDASEYIGSYYQDLVNYFHQAAAYGDAILVRLA